ncbi:hypothetical protein [Streptomyces sp. NPDC053367]|uniref:hypothetical protein n=1 Tax=Streptomyces sp. NPDC053367 TaxID=3365700 RepID=UPI0037D21B71
MGERAGVDGDLEPADGESPVSDLGVSGVLGRDGQPSIEGYPEPWIRDTPGQDEQVALSGYQGRFMDSGAREHRVVAVEERPKTMGKVPRINGDLESLDGEEGGAVGCGAGGGALGGCGGGDEGAVGVEIEGGVDDARAGDEAVPLCGDEDQFVDVGTGKSLGVAVQEDFEVAGEGLAVDRDLEPTNRHDRRAVR